MHRSFPVRQSKAEEGSQQIEEPRRPHKSNNKGGRKKHRPPVRLNLPKSCSFVALQQDNLLQEVSDE